MTLDDHIAEALRLASQGYRRTSGRHHIVSRVDRPDWKEFMAASQAPWDAERGTTDGMDWVRALGRNAADHYRRVYSKDKIEGVPFETFRLIPGSSGDDTGYVEVTQ